MEQKTRRHDRMMTVAEGLLPRVLFLLLLLAPATVQAQHTDAPGDGTAGSVWRLVRVGGGLTSPSGRTGMGLQGVAANEELFVAVGWDGTIAHSRDGNRWVEASFSATDRWLSDVAWGGGRFVAVGGGRAVYSSDGDRWQASSSYGMGNLRVVTWGGDRFVAVGEDGTIAHSRDGNRWRRVQSRVTRADLHGVTWGDGRYVAVGEDGTIVHSSDADHWELAADHEPRADGRLQAVAWNGERFVAVGWSTIGHVTILHSGDGDRWETASYDTSRNFWSLSDVVWNGERFVAVGRKTVLHSEDGDRWEPAAGPMEQDLDAVAWNGARFVAVSWDGTIVHGTDGTHWERAREVGARGDPLPDLDSVAWGGGRFVAVGGWPGTILHSPNGREWHEVKHARSLRGLHDVIWDGTRFVAVGTRIAYSTDGGRVHETDAFVEGLLNAVAWSGARYVAVGDDGLIMYSDDGDRWYRAVDSATTEALNDVAWNGNRFVAVGTHGVIVHSSDGHTWQPAIRPAIPFGVTQRNDDGSWTTYYAFESIAWNGERFVAVGWGHMGTVVHSSDGDHWELADGHGDLRDMHLGAVAWNGERFVAFGHFFDATIMYSVDGHRWEPADEVATVDALHDVAWGNGRFVAVGRNGTIITSP